MAKFIVEMPEKWEPDLCEECNKGFACHIDNNAVTGSCPLANAKKAQEFTLLKGGCF